MKSSGLPQSQKIDPFDTKALSRLLQRQDFAELGKRTRRALKKHPQQASLHAFAGAARAGQGDVGKARQFYEKAVRLDPHNLGYLKHFARLSMHLEDVPKALVGYAKLKSLGVEEPEVNHHLGLCLLRQGRLREALPPLAAALAQAPENPIYAQALAQGFVRAGLFVEAAQAFNVALKNAPTSADILLDFARCLYQAGDSHDALRLADRALAQGGALPDVQAVRAAALGSLGRVAEAKVASRAALTAQENSARHYYNFTLRHDMRQEPKIVRNLQNLVVDNSGDALAHFAMAKAYDDLGQFEAAYEALKQANRLRAQDVRYDEAKELAQLEQLKSHFSTSGALDFSKDTSQPSAIFVLGMPRSGTTLVEAILARHGQVAACGETNALLQSVVSVKPEDGQIAADNAAKLAQQYKARLSHQTAGTAYFTDKMPDNFRFIGHILMAMPDAQILHICRDLRAVAWSNFKTNFMSTRNGFCYDPETLVRYIKAYQDLMAFWHQAFPNRIIDVDYDALSKSPEPQIAQLLTKLGLQWDEACLSPYKSAHAVTTASQSQVRQAIYAGSSDHWRNYEPFAGAWLSRLSPQAHAP